MNKLNDIAQGEKFVIKPNKINKIHQALALIYTLATELDNAELKLNTYNILRDTYSDQKYITNFDYEQALLQKTKIQEKLNKMLGKATKIELTLSGITN